MKLDFNKNLGNSERLLRAGVGFILFMFALRSANRRRSFLLKTTAISQFFDALSSYCFLHDLLGWSSRKKYSTLR